MRTVSRIHCSAVCMQRNGSWFAVVNRNALCRSPFLLRSCTRNHVAEMVMLFLVVLSVPLYFIICTTTVIAVGERNECLQDACPNPAASFVTALVQSDTEETTYPSGKRRSQKCGFLTFQFKDFMRLGNQLFVYASSYGIAKKTSRTLLLPARPKMLLATQFNLSSPEVNGASFQSFERLFNADGNKGGTFNEVLVKGKLKCGTSYYIEGLLQSWKYFHEFRHEIRREFRFSQDLIEASSRRIGEATGRDNAYTTVGVHIRRGDVESEQAKRFGFVTSSVDYLAAAMSHMHSEQSSHADLVFLIVTTDYRWAVDTFGGIQFSRFNVRVLKPESALADMCLLTLCTHLILTQGTYGWWAAYLLRNENGLVVYDKRFAEEGSNLHRIYTASDFFLPKWKGL